MTTIWQRLPKPMFILAPMEDVTDTVFRQIVAKHAPPHLFFTEFTLVEGLMTKGRKATSRRLLHTPAEQPLIAQIWGAQPENFYAAACELASGEFGPFVGIDLNMGCPERKVVRRGSCAGLINHPSRAVEIIQATKEGAGDLPVSVKTRCGTNSWVTEEWAELLLNQDLAALTIHGRIAAEMSIFPARWEEIAKVVALRDRLGKETLIIGNGDVESHADGLAKARAYGVDGLMVGRGIFKNLWFFDPAIDQATIPLHTRLVLLKEHVELWRANWESQKDFHALKKFHKVYFAGIGDIPFLRADLMQMQTVEETLAYLNAVIAKTEAPGAAPALVGSAPS